MTNKYLLPMRRLISASTLAIALSVGSVSGAMLLATSANAQVSMNAALPASFADLVEAVKPAVVSIRVQGVQENNGFSSREGLEFDFPDLPDDHPFRRFFDQFGAPGQNQAPRERRFEASGSGFVISNDGYVVTNNHVVDHAEKVIVVFDGGEELEAEIIGTDERTDLALLKIDGAKDLAFVEFAKKDVRIGDWVVAVGNPFGLGGSVTAGIVSARGRDIGGNSYGDFLQIDAAINRGNSGGPAFNLEGKVIGVNTAIFSPNGGNVGIAFAIPSETVEQIIADLKDDGDVTRGFLGVAIQNVSKDIANSVGLPTARGALVTEPTIGAPAEKAGIKSGDIIVEVNGEPIDDAKDLSRTIGSISPEEKVEIKVWRNGKNIEFKVKLALLDEESLDLKPQEDILQEPAEPLPSSVGITLVPNEAGGLLIEKIEADSYAQRKGLMAGDIIVEANGKMVNSLKEFETIISKVKKDGGDTILIKASRSGSIRFIGLPLKD
jgi:serine protease Do